MNVFRKQKGTVSVLLTLLLVPTLIISGLVTDAARVYGAKSIISDAGMLAMNAGLTYYDSELKDNYGLFALSKAAGDLDIEKYFINTIRASGIDGAENVSSLLDLSADGLDVTGVPGSEIYQTEVEKAQILEYMKYRAPVVIAEELWDKLKEIKNNQEKIDVMDAEMDFADNLDELLEKCQKAKKDIDTFIKYEEKIAREEVAKKETNAKTNLENGTFHCLLGNATATMTDEDQSMEFSKAFHYFIDEAAVFKEEYNGGGDGSSLRYYFEDYILCMRYYQIIGRYSYDDQALEAYIKQKLENEGMSAWEAYDAYQIFTNDKGILDAYSLACSNLGLDGIGDGKSAIGGVYANFFAAQIYLKDAISSVNDLKSALETANNSYSTWKQKIDQLPDGDEEDSFKTCQQKEADVYKELMDEETINDFLSKMNSNLTYVGDGVAYLESYSFMGYELWKADIEPETIGDEVIKIEMEVSTIDEVEEKRDEVMSNQFVTPDKELEGNPILLEKEKFYELLCDLCTEKTTGAEADSKTKASEIFNLNDFVEVEEGLKSLKDGDWTGVTRPSTRLNENNKENTLLSSSADSSLSKGIDVTDASSYKNGINRVRSVMSQMRTFLTKIDEILTNNLENLYLMEYGIQMFSYYTVDKDENGNTINSGLTSISGDDLTKHAMYKSEAEYILWGKDSAWDNVNRTRLLLYGIRVMCNLFYAFSDPVIEESTLGIATVLSFGIVFLIPKISILLKFSIALAESAFDVKELMLGRSVPIIKNATNSNVAKAMGWSDSANNQAVTMNYKEYLSLFMMLHMVGTFEATALARMADCIQLNTENLDITTSYTMIAVSADVKVRTTFLRKASAWSGSNSITSDYYTISYKSCLGY